MIMRIVAVGAVALGSIVTHWHTSATPATAVEPPSIQVQADCGGIHLTTSGIPEEASGWVGIDQHPPGIAVFNDSVTYPVEPLDGIMWDVYIHMPGTPDRDLTGELDCAPIATPPVATPVQSCPAALVEASPSFPGYELAPPW